MDHEPNYPRHRDLRVRIYLAIVYGLLVFTTLVAQYRDSYFCNRIGKFGFMAPVVTLSVAVTLLDLIASLCARGLDLRWVPKGPRIYIAPVACSVIVACGLSYLPFWIYLGYGHFRFENTVLNVSCLFSEGYGIVFLYIFAPLFAILSLVRELILERALRPRHAA